MCADRCVDTDIGQRNVPIMVVIVYLMSKGFIQMTINIRVQQPYELTSIWLIIGILGEINLSIKAVEKTNTDKAHVYFHYFGQK